VPLSDHAESSQVRETKLEPAHDIPNNPVLTLRNNERFRAALVDFHEEVRTVVLRKTDPVYLDDRREIVRPKRPKKIGRFQQQASALEENF
jgi:hypothetical protein